MIPALDPELSRLAFEERLIEYCEDTSLPLLERVRLLGIAASRMDTFYMTRIGRLKRLVAVGKKRSHGSNSEELLERAASAAHGIMDRAYKLLEHDLVPALTKTGVHIQAWDDLTDDERDAVKRAHREQLDNCLRPLEVAPTSLFPHVRNLRPAVIAMAASGNGALAVIELPEDLPRFIPLPRDPHRLIPLEDVIGGAVSDLWPDRRFERVHVFRVTRSAIMDLEQDADADDVLEMVEQEVARRPFQEVVRAELDRGMPEEVRARLLKDLRHEAEMQGSSLDERDLYPVDRLVDLATALSQVADLDLPALKSPPVAQRHPDFGRSLIAAVRKQDILVRFPYDAYEATVGRVLDEASKRGEVESMKIALYRAGKDSAVVQALRTARARGADVTASVELKASFDERDNIELARSLEGDGVRVLLSPADLKVHAKVALVTLKDHGPARQIVMIGTGNLNPKTAGSYVDVWLLSADDDRAADLEAVFSVLMGQTKTPKLRKLMVSPFNMRSRFLELIGRETENAKAGKPSGIRAAMNGLSDNEISDALRRASQAGVKIELMVRGVCSLLPGVPGESENIRITSVLGQLLQHARIYEFCNAGEYDYYIGSADWRPRNMDHRIEVVTPVDRAQHEQVREALNLTLEDRAAWVLGPDGSYVRADATEAART